MESRTSEIETILAELSTSPVPLDEAAAAVPNCPGLYAIYGDAATWLELGLGGPPDSRPLYVGKAEQSLVTRDLRTHFGTGRTGQSTVRRSFAALLRDALSLEALPRNPKKPERFANYGLAAGGDERLTTWMLERLSITVWPRNGSSPLVELERKVLRRWLPALNLKDVQTPWSARLRGARKVMAEDARRNARRV